MDEVLAACQLKSVSVADNPERQKINLAEVFPDAREIWLEIGFGSGEHLAALAAQHPDIGFIGAEPYLNGVASLLGKIRNESLGNIALHHGDVRDLMDVLDCPQRTRI